MKSIRIDVARYCTEFDRPPLESELGIWTYLVDGSPLALYGTYGEATAQVKLHVRLAGLEGCAIELTDRARSGRVRVGLG